MRCNKRERGRKSRTGQRTEASSSRSPLFHRLLRERSSEERVEPITTALPTSFLAGLFSLGPACVPAREPRDLGGTLPVTWIEELRVSGPCPRRRTARARNLPGIRWVRQRQAGDFIRTYRSRQTRPVTPDGPAPEVRERTPRWTLERCTGPGGVALELHSSCLRATRGTPEMADFHRASGAEQAGSASSMTSRSVVVSSPPQVEVVLQLATSVSDSRTSSRHTVA